MLGINWQDILLHVFNFALLAILLNELLYNPINKFIENREAYYKNLEIEKLKNLEDSKALLQERTQKLAIIQQEAKEIKDKAIRESQIQANLKIENAQAEGEKIIEQSRIKAKLERDTLIRNTRKDLKEVVVEAAAKLALLNGNVYDDFLDHTEEDIDE
ncbi:ATP synthase F0 subunit B [Helcococcus ovis]|uniref:ATP synthase subunit b n=1 Tax=Helcococcus ovis TaxID=72026 RepID=A0A4R9C383_9FIRM|nr:ATP synthase F0 subunit B [Helcococcus ovis]TFF64413.1 hypothetical protein EQF92_05680 [Helcococcus ovis]TFF65792.1 hypothetical protein EQF91_05200 [Helcococcus ovis]TFF68912.1 hypothetical protein EQF93_00380 [Helcococcus ovis]WNZ00658.1 ATP synthase F0 subunit B [Helcococcus ovis]